MGISVADYSGQTDLFDPATFTWPVHLVGLGGIGSAVALPLVKMGLRTSLHLWDDDCVERHNLPSQMLYRNDDVGRHKVEAAAEILAGYRHLETEGGVERRGLEVVPHVHRVTPDSHEGFAGIVISGVDSMAARRLIWEKLRFDPEVALYIDGRIGGEKFTLLPAIPSDPDSMDRYESWLFDDSEGSELPCAARNIIYTQVMLGSAIAGVFARFARKQPLPYIVNGHAGKLQVVSTGLPDGES